MPEDWFKSSQENEFKKWLIYLFIGLKMSALGRGRDNNVIRIEKDSASIKTWYNK